MASALGDDCEEEDVYDESALLTAASDNNGGKHTTVPSLLPVSFEAVQDSNEEMETSRANIIENYEMAKANNKVARVYRAIKKMRCVARH